MLGWFFGLYCKGWFLWQRYLKLKRKIVCLNVELQGIGPMRRVAAKSVILAPKADKVAVRGVRGLVQVVL